MSFTRRSSLIKTDLQLIMIAPAQHIQNAFAEVTKQLDNRNYHYIIVDNPSQLYQFLNTRKQSNTMIIINTNYQDSADIAENIHQFMLEKTSNIKIYTYPKKLQFQIFQNLPNIGKLIKKYEDYLYGNPDGKRISIRSIHKTPEKNNTNKGHQYLYIKKLYQENTSPFNQLCEAIEKCNHPNIKSLNLAHKQQMSQHKHDKKSLIFCHIINIEQLLSTFEDSAIKKKFQYIVYDVDNDNKLLLQKNSILLASRVEKELLNQICDLGFDVRSAWTHVTKIREDRKRQQQLIKKQRNLERQKKKKLELEQQRQKQQRNIQIVTHYNIQSQQKPQVNKAIEKILPIQTKMLKNEDHDEAIKTLQIDSVDKLEEIKKIEYYPNKINGTKSAQIIPENSNVHPQAKVQIKSAPSSKVKKSVENPSTPSQNKEIQQSSNNDHQNAKKLQKSMSLSSKGTQKIQVHSQSYLKKQSPSLPSPKQYSKKFDFKKYPTNIQLPSQESKQLELKPTKTLSQQKIKSQLKVSNNKLKFQKNYFQRPLHSVIVEVSSQQIISERSKDLTKLMEGQTSILRQELKRIQGSNMKEDSKSSYFKLQKQRLKNERRYSSSSQKQSDKKIESNKIIHSTNDLGKRIDLPSQSKEVQKHSQGNSQYYKMQQSLKSPVKKVELSNKAIQNNSPSKVQSKSIKAKKRIIVMKSKSKSKLNKKPQELDMSLAQPNVSINLSSPQSIVAKGIQSQQTLQKQSSKNSISKLSVEKSKLPKPYQQYHVRECNIKPSYKSENLVPPIVKQYHSESKRRSQNLDIKLKIEVKEEIRQNNADELSNLNKINRHFRYYVHSTQISKHISQIASTVSDSSPLITFKTLDQLSRSLKRQKLNQLDYILIFPGQAEISNISQCDVQNISKCYLVLLGQTTTINQPEHKIYLTNYKQLPKIKKELFLQQSKIPSESIAMVKKTKLFYKNHVLKIGAFIKLFPCEQFERQPFSINAELFYLLSNCNQNDDILIVTNQQGIQDLSKNITTILETIYKICIICIPSFTSNRNFELDSEVIFINRPQQQTYQSIERKINRQKSITSTLILLKPIYLHMNHKNLAQKIQAIYHHKFQVILFQDLNKIQQMLMRNQRQQRSILILQKQFESQQQINPQLFEAIYVFGKRQIPLKIPINISDQAELLDVLSTHT